MNDMLVLMHCLLTMKFLMYTYPIIFYCVGKYMFTFKYEHQMLPHSFRIQAFAV